MREKVKSWDELKEIVDLAKSQGKKVVFTNGCFDIIHIGHTRYLEDAKKTGDIFIVAINSDSSVRALKGDTRPIISEDERAEVVAALGCVDYVTIFSEPDPLKIITYLRPNVLAKGGDWGADAIIGRDVVEGDGGKVIRVPVIEGAATTNIVKRVLDRHAPGGNGGVSPDVKSRAEKVRLLVVDIDGVLTDGRIIYSDRGEEIKGFDVRDGHGIKLLMRGGVDVAILTGRESQVVLHRARDLGITTVCQGAKDKLPVFENMIRDKGLNLDEVAYMGDDLVDLPVLNKVGLSAAPGDADDEVRRSVHYVAKARGGRGAARELCETILRCQGKWEGISSRYRQ